MQNTKLLHLSRYLPFQEGLQMVDTEGKKEPFNFTGYLSNPTTKLVLHSFDYIVKEYHSKSFLDTLVYQFTKVLVDAYDMQRCELVRQDYKNNSFSVYYLNTSTDTRFTILFSEQGIGIIGQFTEVFHYQAALEFLYSKHIAYGMAEEEYQDKDKSIVESTNLVTV